MARYESVVGPHGSGTPNDNTDRLLNLCAEAETRLTQLFLQESTSGSQQLA